MTGKVTILIIDDDEGVRTLLARHLASLDADLRFADNVEDGMAEMRKLPHPNFVFLDLGFPKSTPEETLARATEMKDLNPGCVIVAITGRGDPNLPILAAKMGIDKFKQKLDLASQTALFETVKECLSRKVSQQPQYVRNQEMLDTLTRLMTA